MKQVTFYNIETGDITRIATLADDMIDVNTQEGENWVEGIYNKETQKVENGSVVSIADEILDQRKIDNAWLDLRQYRNISLLESDWTQTLDAPLTDSKKAEWSTYRQQLRDLPSNTTDPLNPNLPVKPS